ncbi:MAG TPA: sigma-54 dependent transcriptional regulator [Candidatus Ozemobacteraceae bacterium]|nr:sigma-54 dependent transcriptional regulator [Candidatus Ozemobacteraceae bacterium]
MSKKILLIDDEVKLLQALKKALEREGYEVFGFADPAGALEFALQRELDLVISDIRMPGLSGLELMSRLGASGRAVPTMLMTAYSSVETAVTAMKMGARDYLIKPFEVGDFKAAVRKVLAAGADETKAEEPESKYEIVGHSAAIKQVLDLIGQVADTESTVLLQGESGTGKELVARALHLCSRRSDRPFVPVNCSTLPETLFESEVFGHVRGSFTGAVGDKIGLLVEAQGGTLFLDEIGDLAPANQAKLLRVLQDGTFKRVGDARTMTADVRVLAATNRQLRQEVAAGRFREDLLYRLAVVEIRLPPLRERLDDLHELAGHFLRRAAVKHHRPQPVFDEALVRHLATHSWPGNIRELENYLERAVILTRDARLTPQSVPLPKTTEESPTASREQPLPGVDGSLGETIDRIEQELVMRALESAQGNHSRAAEMLGVTRQNLHYKIKKYRLQDRGRS